MAVIDLNESDQKLLNAVIDEMVNIPEKVGIKYAKNARRSFQRIWTKMQSGKGAAASNGANSEEGDDTEGPKKTAAKKKASSQKAPVAKKAVGKVSGPKKATQGASKPDRAPRKTKKEKENEAAAATAEASEHENNEDEDMEEDNEDGKSHTPKAPDATLEPFKNITSIEPPASDGVSVVVAGAKEASAPAKAKATTPDATEVAYTEARANYVVPIMDDVHEAFIREMPLEAWLKWKAESGYTFDLLNV